MSRTFLAIKSHWLRGWGGHLGKESPSSLRVDRRLTAKLCLTGDELKRTRVLAAAAFGRKLFTMESDLRANATSLRCRQSNASDVKGSLLQTGTGRHDSRPQMALHRKCLATTDLGDPRSIALWDAETEERLTSLTTHPSLEEPPRSLALNATHVFAAAGDKMAAVCGWRRQGLLENKMATVFVMADPEKRSLALQASDDFLVAFDAEGGSSERWLTAHHAENLRIAVLELPGDGAEGDRARLSSTDLLAVLSGFLTGGSRVELAVYNLRAGGQQVLRLSHFEGRRLERPAALLGER